MTIRDHYDIRMSEAQRQYFITALALIRSLNYLGADPVDRTEIDMLTGMLDDVTDDDREPDCLHDFTL